MSASEPYTKKAADPGKAARAKLSREEINALPLFHYEGKISLVRSAKDMESAVKRLRGAPVLGFDTETRPSFRKGKSSSPSLVQLAAENEVFLFQLKLQPMRAGLVELFENPAVIKTGVGVHDDMRFLAGLSPFTAQAVVDLGEVARRNGVDNRGLRGLAAAFLDLRISKGEQCSNWARQELSPRQIRYAATDAWISRAVYFSMLEAGFDVSPAKGAPPRRTASGRPGAKTSFGMRV
jgi:hypothetical protein